MSRKKTEVLMMGQVEKRLDSLRGMNTEMPMGWIRGIRESLGMSLEQLSCRLKMTPQGVARMEKSEQKGTISLNTLRKVSEVFNADLKVAIVPTEALHELKKKQARLVATKIVHKTQKHMALEDQANTPQFLEDQIEKISKELIEKNDRSLWDDEDTSS